MKITEMLQRLRRKKPYPSTPAIAGKIAQIKAICDAQFFNQSFFGNAALNRQMLLDTRIASLLTPDVLRYLFTNKPTASEKIARNSTGTINLRDAIYYGFADGLLTVQLMPNNEPDYSPQKYAQQQKNFENNTLHLVDNIKQASGVGTVAKEQLDDHSLLDQFETIVKTIRLIKDAGRADKLLHVPGYTADDMRKQVNSGFARLSAKLHIRLSKETLDSVCEKFLQSPELMLDPYVSHLFYDRAHIEAALEQDTELWIGNKPYKYEDIFRRMVAKVAMEPDKYPACAKEQLYLRFNQVQADLGNRFERVVVPENTNPLTQGPLPKTEYTYQLQLLTRQLMQNKAFTVKQEGDSSILRFADGSAYDLTKIMRYANVEHLQMQPLDYQYYLTYHEEQSNMYSQLDKPRLAELRREYKDLDAAEMHAMNIYTQPGYYHEMNGFMRGTYPFETRKSEDIRGVIIHSVMCGSGLSKIPDQSIQRAYRAETVYDEDVQRKRLEGASKKEVIRLDGFVSSSTTNEYINKIEYYSKKQTQTVVFELSNLKGKYIAPFAVYAFENEYLIPPTQLQLESSQQSDNHTVFRANVVSDLASVPQEALLFDPQKNQALEQALTASNAAGAKEILTHFLKNEIARLQPNYFKSIWLRVANSQEKIDALTACLDKIPTVSTPKEFRYLMQEIKAATGIQRHSKETTPESADKFVALKQRLQKILPRADAPLAEYKGPKPGG